MRRDLLDTHDPTALEPWVRRASRSTNRQRSSYRKQARPAPTITAGSSATRSVHCRGSRASCPASSSKYTRDSPHVCRHSINWKTRPHRGWKGCVTRKVCGAPLVGGAIDSSRQRVCRPADRVDASGMPRSRHHRQMPSGISTSGTRSRPWRRWRGSRDCCAPSSKRPSTTNSSSRTRFGGCPVSGAHHARASRRSRRALGRADRAVTSSLAPLVEHLVRVRPHQVGHGRFTTRQHAIHGRDVAAHDRCECLGGHAWIALLRLQNQRALVRRQSAPVPRPGRLAKPRLKGPRCRAHGDSPRFGPDSRSSRSAPPGAGARAASRSWLRCPFSHDEGRRHGGWALDRPHHRRSARWPHRRAEQLRSRRDRLVRASTT